MAGKRVKNAAPNPVGDLSADKSGGTKKAFRITFKLSLLLGLISFLVYANTLKNGFVLDDDLAIKENALVKKGIPAIPELLATPYHHGWNPDYHDNLYRPLSLALFAAEYQFFELDPAPYHFLNILVFAGCVILLFLFLDKVFERKKTAVAFLASLLFALHPIHTEVVANIKSGDELLCFFFAFLCMNVFIRYVQTGKILQLLTGAFCFLLSLLSKETSITFLFVIPLVFFFYRNERKKRSIPISVSIAVVAIIFLIARFSILNHYYSGNYAPVGTIENALASNDLSFEPRIATAILILGYYIKLLFVPYPLICDYSYNSIPYVHFSDPWVLCSLLFYLFLAVFGVMRLIKNRRDPFAFGILFFLITLSLFSNIFFLIGFTMAERFLFFGSVGFCLVVALLIERWAGKAVVTGIAILKKPKVLGIIIPLSVIYAIITFNRNKDWSDNYTLYTTDLEKAPNDARLHYYVADYLLTHLFKEKDIAMQKETVDEAMSLLYKAVEIYPGYVNAQCDLGILYYDLHQSDSAETHYKEAYELDPTNIPVISGLAHLYFVNKQYRRSIDYNQKAIDISPDYPMTYSNSAFCYLDLGKFDSAILYANKAIALDPKLYGPYQILVFAYQAIGNTDSSKKYEAIAQSYHR